MADPTVPWGIPLFDDNTPFAPIQAPFNSQSAALNDALNAIGADTGWVSVTPNSTYAGSSVKVRKHAGFTIMRGQFTRASGNVTIGEDVATVPNGFAPIGSQVVLMAPGSGVVVCKMVIGIDGSIRVAGVAENTGYLIADNFIYPST